MTETCSISREELFELVWTEPSTKLAKRFGISDVALAKICKKYDIPKPGLGYWRQKQAGSAGKRPFLPKLEKPLANSIRIGRPKSPTEETAEEDGETLVIQVPDRLSKPHALIKETREALTTGYRSEYGFTYSRKPTLDVRVTKGSLSRALRILDTLIKSLEERGHQVRISTDRDRSVALINTHEVAFSIEERQRQISKKENERAELAPTGQLSLVLRGAFNGHRENWRDGKRQRVEQFLGDFILEMESVAEARRLQAEEWRKDREEREKREVARRQEKQRREQFKQLLERKRFADDGRALLAAMRERCSKEAVPEAWFTWAEGYLDSIDPLLNPVTFSSSDLGYGRQEPDW